MLALDWAKAFDSVAPASLVQALQRFGIPNEFVQMVQAIYSRRRFSVRDAGETSSLHPQFFGISQGCPLSPYLFVVMMSVLMHDAKGGVEDIGVSDLVYADDTLLLGTCSEDLHKFMSKIGEAGMEYGLVFNWGKLETLPVRTEAVIRKPDGGAIATKSSILYLGSSLASDGRFGSELNRRLGMARSDFDKLRLAWSHSSISTRRKVQIFDACILAKLLYGLHVAWLNQTERRRLDGFHARCIRCILKIAPSYYSRVSNVTVWQRARTQCLSKRLLQQQLHYFWKLTVASSEHPCREYVFEDGATDLRRLSGIRRVGRPRMEWATEVHKHAVKVAGSQERLSEGFSSREWRRCVHEYVGSM